MVNKKMKAMVAAVILSVVEGLGNMEAGAAWAAEQSAGFQPGASGVESNKPQRDQRDFPSCTQSFGTQASCNPGWHQSSSGWYWQERDGSLHHGWLTDGGRTYYMDDNGLMVTGWREIDGDWYYFHQDGAMNLGELNLDTGCYQFTSDGALASVSWAPNTGGGAYDAGCYDETAQGLLDHLNEEKKEQYFDAHPDDEDEYDGDMHRPYDRYAGFTMNMDLNKLAACRLDGAIQQGYTANLIPGEGDLKEYLSGINSIYRNRTLLELYVRACEDESEAFDKIMDKAGRRSASKSNRAYSLEYYRQLGMAHRELEGKHYFMVILMR